MVSIFRAIDALLEKAEDKTAMVSTHKDLALMTDLVGEAQDIIVEVRGMISRGDTDEIRELS